MARQLGLGEHWLALSEEQREEIRAEVRATRVAHGLPAEADPARLAQTKAMLRRWKLEREAGAA